MKKLIIISLTIIMFFFKNSAMSNNQKSFYDLEIESINGEIIKLKDYRDKVILIVNTASYCGFTKQYEDLQDLWDKYKSKGLIVLGVPSDSFNQKKKVEFGEFFKKITPIIEQYVNEKKIDIVLDKKNIFLASKKKDITREIINIIDSKIK